MTPIFITRTQLSERWSVCKETLQRYEKAGMLIQLKLGYVVRYRITDIERIEEQSEVHYRPHFKETELGELSVNERIEEQSELQYRPLKETELGETSLNDIEFSVRTENCLHNANIQTLGQLVLKSEADLLEYHGLGKKCLNEIKNKLTQLGLGLGMPKERKEDEDA